MPFKVHPLSDECRHDFTPVLKGWAVKVLAIILHRVPRPRKWRWDDMENINAASHEWDMVVRDKTPAKLRWQLSRLGQELSLWSCL